MPTKRNNYLKYYLCVINFYFVQKETQYFTGSKRPRMELNDDENTEDLFERMSKNVSKANSSSIGAPNARPQCENCATFGADQRNDHFTRLILEELKYVAPCMRSRAYVKILNFINTIKNCHTQDIDLTDTEKN